MPNPKVLIIEDEVTRRDWFRRSLDGIAVLTFAETAIGAIAHIRRDAYDKVFLDHDLGCDEINGTDVAACVYRSKNIVANFFVHSINPDGADRMASILGGILIPPATVWKMPFCSEGFEKAVLEFINE